MSSLPSHWVCLPLAEVTSSIANGFTHQNNLASGGMPISRIQTISKGEIDFELVGYAGLRLEDVTKYVLNPGDILFSHINSKEHVGKVAIYRDGMPTLIHGMNLLRIVANDKVLPAYLFWAFRTDAVRSQIWANTRHAVNQASINIRNLSTVEIPVPPLEEQKRIVEALDDHLSRLDKALAEIQSQKYKVPSIFQELIDRAYWSEEHAFVPLSDFGDWVTGSTPSTKNPLYFGGGIPFVTPPEVKNSQKVTATKRSLTQAGALQVRVLDKPSIHLVCIGTVGKLGFSEGAAATNQQITSLVPGAGVDFDYALDLFSSQEAQRRFSKASGKSNMPMLAKGSLLRIEMPLPSLEVQRRLKAQVGGLRESEKTTIARFQAIENRIVHLRRSILRSAFLGILGNSNG